MGLDLRQKKCEDGKGWGDKRKNNEVVQKSPLNFVVQAEFMKTLTVNFWKEDASKVGGEAENNP